LSREPEKLGRALARNTRERLEDISKDTAHKTDLISH